MTYQGLCFHIMRGHDLIVDLWSPYFRSWLMKTPCTSREVMTSSEVKGGLRVHLMRGQHLTIGQRGAACSPHERSWPIRGCVHTLMRGLDLIIDIWSPYFRSWLMKTPMVHGYMACNRGMGLVVGSCAKQYMSWPIMVYSWEDTWTYIHVVLGGWLLVVHNSSCHDLSWCTTRADTWTHVRCRGYEVGCVQGRGDIRCDLCTTVHDMTFSWCTTWADTWSSAFCTVVHRRLISQR